MDGTLFFSGFEMRCHPFKINPEKFHLSDGLYEYFIPVKNRVNFQLK